MVPVSVVVPTYNRRALLERCLRSLLAQSLTPQAYEIIIADDESSPLTEKLIRELQFEFPIHELRYVPVAVRGGPACARNIGWMMARGDIIAFTNDDCVAYPHWLEAGIDAINADASAAWGRLVMPLPKNPTDFEWSASQLSAAEFVTANCFCLKSVLKEVGGFDERFQSPWREDTDLYFNLLEHRKRIAHIPEAVIEHPLRKGPFAVCLHQQKNNLYEALLFKKHPGLYRTKVSSSCMKYYYAAVFGFLIWAAGLFSQSWPLTVAGALAWMPLFVYFFYIRIKRTSKHPKHIAEMAFTSFLIPPLSIAWRLAGAIRYKVIFF